MDLAAFFSESVEAARSHHKHPKNDPGVPAVPGQADESGNGQVSVSISRSRSSRSSRSQNADEVSDQYAAAQACAHVRGGERARGWLAEEREQREQRHLTYREKSGQPQGVLIWEFGRPGASLVDPVA